MRNKIYSVEADVFLSMKTLWAQKIQRLFNLV